ncbi:lipopolysaccharide biosynthesis protein [Providencia manganoxydans]|uniref:Polysaccharide biosynthesis protein n=1 Tax=Providencia stuartii TaxID=588 RepID=A0A1S1HK36_PROST|nr:oligosaccharide flippase family protein [Providencia stuartii]OHT22615.1 hypothetical protein A3Q29_10895 [Providencia stuartii]
MKKAIINVLFSNFSAAGLGFLLNVILARTLTINEYGYITLLFSFVAIIYTVFDFGFNTTQVVEFNKSEHKDKTLGKIFKLYKKYFTFLAIITIIVVFALNLIYKFSALEIISITLGVISFLLFRYQLSIYQSQGLWKKYSALNILNNLLKLVAILGFIIFSSSLDKNIYHEVLKGYILYTIVTIIIVLFHFKENNSLPYDNAPGFAKKFFKMSYPIGLSNILVIMTMRADYFIVEHYLGTSSLGIYAAANSLALVFPLITTSILNVFLKYSSESNKDFLNFIIQKQLRLIKFIPLFIIIGYFFSKKIFEVIFGLEYLSASNIFSILLIAYVGGIIFIPLESYFYSHKPKKILILKIIQMLTAIILEIILINSIGLIGIPIAITISRLVGWIYIYSLSHRELKNA